MEQSERDPRKVYPSAKDLPRLLRTLITGLERNCSQCGAAMVAPEWSAHLSETRVRNVWSCEGCGYQFEDTVYLSAPEAVGETVNGE
jgi:hypothetical protein